MLIKNALIVNIIHKKNNFCDNEVPKCIILVLFKRARYWMIQIAIVRHNIETIVNFEPQYNCQYHLQPHRHQWCNG